MFIPAQNRALAGSPHSQDPGDSVFYLEFRQLSKTFIVNGTIFKRCNNCRKTSCEHNIPLLTKSIASNNIVYSIPEYTEKVDKVRGYVKGKLDHLWKEHNKTHRILSKKVVRLKIDLKREIEEGIKN